MPASPGVLPTRGALVWECRGLRPAPRAPRASRLHSLASRSRLQSGRPPHRPGMIARPCRRKRRRAGGRELRSGQRRESSRRSDRATTGPLPNLLISRSCDGSTVRDSAIVRSPASILWRLIPLHDLWSHACSPASDKYRHPDDGMSTAFQVSMRETPRARFARYSSILMMNSSLAPMNWTPIPRRGARWTT